MSKTSVPVNLFRVLIVGVVLFSGGYVIANAVLNANKDKTNPGPFEVTFKLDTQPGTLTEEVCVNPGEGYNCLDSKIVAYYGDNYQSLEKKIPVAGVKGGYPALTDYHIEWDIDNLYKVESNVVVKGRYVPNALRHKVTFYTDYDAFIGYILVDNMKSPALDLITPMNRLAKSDFERVGYEFVKWEYYFEDRFDEANKPLKADISAVIDDIKAIGIYQARSVVVNFLDLDGGSVITSVNNRYNEKLVAIPEIVMDKFNSHVAKDDAFYYFAKMKTQDDGTIIEDDNVVINSAMLPNIITASNDETYNIQIRKRNNVSIKFISSYNGQTEIDRKDFYFSDRHIIRESDFVGIKQIKANGVEVRWPVHLWLGVRVDRDLVIEAECIPSSLTITIDTYLKNPTTFNYEKKTDILKEKTQAIPYGGTLVVPPGADGLYAYSFEYFLVEGDPKHYKESELMLLVFTHDAKISAFFAHRSAKIIFQNSNYNGTTDRVELKSYINAPNVKFPISSASVIVPKGKYFTNKWTYTYREFNSDGSYLTMNGVYDSSITTNTIFVRESETILTPQFESIYFTVRFYNQAGDTVSQEFSKVIYGSNFQGRPSAPVTGGNEVFLRWEFSADKSVRANNSIVPTLGNIIGSNGDVLAFIPIIQTNEKKINFYIGSSNSAPLVIFSNNGYSTIADYIAMYEGGTGYQKPSRDGYTFEKWSSFDYLPSHVPSINQDFSIFASFTPNRYQVSYTLVLDDGSGANKNEALTLATPNYVTIGAPYGFSNDALLNDANLALLNILRQIDPNATMDDTKYYEISTSFNTSEDFTGKTITSTTVIEYINSSFTPDSVESNRKFSVYIKANLRTVNITYIVVIPATDGGFDHVLSLGDNDGYSYTYLANSNGYQFKWASDFNSSELHDFLGWRVQGDPTNTVFSSEGSYIPNSYITKDLVLVAVLGRHNP